MDIPEISIRFAGLNTQNSWAGATGLLFIALMRFSPFVIRLQGRERRCRKVGNVGESR
jgi:hypothetical protein